MKKSQKAQTVSKSLEVASHISPKLHGPIFHAGPY